MVDRKENYKFDLGVKGLNSKSKCLRLLALTRLILSRQSDIIVCKDGFLFLLHNSSFAFHSISFFGPKYCVTLRNNLNGIRCICISYVFFFGNGEVTCILPGHVNSRHEQWHVHITWMYSSKP